MFAVNFSPAAAAAASKANLPLNCGKHLGGGGRVDRGKKAPFGERDLPLGSVFQQGAVRLWLV